jgi:hypothetical protein
MPAVNEGPGLRVPASEYPAVMVFYQMGQAGALAGLQYSVDTSTAWMLAAIIDQRRISNFRAKHGTEPTASFVHLPDSFARMLVKIAYGQVLTSLDLGDFRPYCLPFIMGSLSNLSHIVGSCKGAIEPGLGYRLRTYAFGREDRMFLVAEVHLLANNDTPVYHVLVGDVAGQAKVERIRAKLSGTDVTILGPENPSQVIPPWAPTTWPTMLESAEVRAPQSLLLAP